jgi:hypothetical protein
MLDGVMLLWFILTALSVLFVTIDIRWTPEAIVLKWGFVILTLFTGPLGAFFYVLGCREPLPGTHEKYVSATWRQVLGSTMHCAAGDGLGILVGAVIGSVLKVSPGIDIALEYVIGFSFGWLFFQAYAMRDMAGGSYTKSLKMTFIPEFYSMNVLMVGMLLVSRFWIPEVAGADSPSSAAFWYIMSMALIAGFLCAYPMNWWLVTRKLKHGMVTIRKHATDQAAAAAPDHDMGAMDQMTPDAKEGGMQHDGPSDRADHDMGAMDQMTPDAKEGGMQHDGPSDHADHDMGQTRPSKGTIYAVGALSVVILAVCIVIVLVLAPA